MGNSQHSFRASGIGLSRGSLTTCTFTLMIMLLFLVAHNDDDYHAA